MTRGLGIVAEKNAIAYTLLSQDAQDGPVTVIDESELTTPGAHRERGAQLLWLYAEMRQLLARIAPDRIVMQKPGAGFSRDRVEVEAIVRLAAAEAGVSVEMVVNDGVRARLGGPREPGAFERMLADPEVAARSNKARRERYLLAKAALRR